MESLVEYSINQNFLDLVHITINKKNPLKDIMNAFNLFIADEWPFIYLDRNIKLDNKNQTYVIDDIQIFPDHLINEHCKVLNIHGDNASYIQIIFSEQWIENSNIYRETTVVFI